MVNIIDGDNAEAEQLVYGCYKCADKFVNNVQLTEHLIREHETAIDVLPDELFKHLFEFLHPNDLVEMSQTSHHFKDLVADHFKRKRQCEYVHIIDDNGNPKFEFRAKEKYEIYFRSIIRNISLTIN